MKTNIPEAALANPDIALANDGIRTCVHLHGICLSHCPTYQVRHDETDSPRGRIVLIREMYEQGGTPDAKTVEHLDRCLTCLACEAICPSGVQYSKLIGHGLEHVEATYRRPLLRRVIRRTLTVLIPSSRLFRLGTPSGETGPAVQMDVLGIASRHARHDTEKRLTPRESCGSPTGFPRTGDPPGAGQYS